MWLEHEAYGLRAIFHIQLWSETINQYLVFLMALSLHLQIATHIRAVSIPQHYWPSLFGRLASATPRGRSSIGRCHCTGNKHGVEFTPIGRRYAQPLWGPSIHALPQDMLPVSCRICVSPGSTPVCGVTMLSHVTNHVFCQQGYNRAVKSAVVNSKPQDLPHRLHPLGSRALSALLGP